MKKWVYAYIAVVVFFLGCGEDNPYQSGSIKPRGTTHFDQITRGQRCIVNNHQIATAAVGDTLQTIHDKIRCNPTLEFQEDTAFCEDGATIIYRCFFKEKGHHIPESKRLLFTAWLDGSGHTIGIESTSSYCQTMEDITYGTTLGSAIKVYGRPSIFPQGESVCAGFSKIPGISFYLSFDFPRSLWLSEDTRIELDMPPCEMTTMRGFLVGNNPEGAAKNMETEAKPWILSEDIVGPLKVGNYVEDIKEKVKNVPGMVVKEGTEVYSTGAGFPSETVAVCHLFQNDRIILTSWLDSQSRTLGRVTVNDGRFVTAEGIQIGMSLGKTVEAYGMPEIQFDDVLGDIAIFQRKSRFIFGLGFDEKKLPLDVWASSQKTITLIHSPIDMLYVRVIYVWLANA